MTPLSIHLDWLFFFFGKSPQEPLSICLDLFLLNDFNITSANYAPRTSKISNPSLMCHFPSKLLPLISLCSCRRIRRTSTSTFAPPCLCSCQCHPYWRILWLAAIPVACCFQIDCPAPDMVTSPSTMRSWAARPLHGYRDQGRGRPPFARY